MVRSVLVILYLANGLLAVVNGRHFERCELAEELVKNLKIPESQINDWLCLVEGESQFNSSAVGTLNWDASKDLGLFQISDKYWCDWGTPRLTGCRLKCEDLLDDDIADDVRCVQEIFDEHQRLSGNGFNAWVAWKVKCEGQNLEHLTSGCQWISSNAVTSYKFRPGIAAPRYSKKKGAFLKKIKKPMDRKYHL